MSVSRYFYLYTEAEGKERAGLVAEVLNSSVVT